GEERILQDVVDDGLPARARARIPPDPLEFAEGAAHRELNGIIAVLAQIAQAVNAVVRILVRSERQAANAGLADVSSLSVEIPSQLALDAQAGDPIPSGAEPALIHLTRGLDRS